MFVLGTTSFRLKLVERMRVWTVTEIVAQTSDKHKFDLPRCDLELWLCTLQVAHHGFPEVGYSKGVLEPCMRRTGEHEVGRP